MAKKKRESFFWTSYSDLMTSLFFIMLTLFVLAIALLHREVVQIGKERDATEAELKKINEIRTAVQSIDSTYFSYDPAYKKHILKTEVLNDKKFEQIKNKFANVKNLADAQKAGAKVDSVKQITFGAPVFVQATGASEPALSGAVAGVKQGEFSPAIVKGNAGAYLFQVNRKAAREGEKFDAKAVEMRLQQQATQAASRFISELYQKANVVDNRYLFF